MSDLGTIEKRTVYQIPEGEGFHSPYVESEPWSEGTVTVDGDMMPVEQHAIPWCITHDMKAVIVQDGIRGFCPLLGKRNDDPCVVSQGGLEHKWWVDL